MSQLTKSPLRVAREALAVATGRLHAYAHQFSPKKFTQPQLFACLVLKNFLKTDYRGIVAHLADCPLLVEALGLTGVPHYTSGFETMPGSHKIGNSQRALRLCGSWNAYR